MFEFVVAETWLRFASQREAGIMTPLRYIVEKRKLMPPLSLLQIGILMNRCSFNPVGTAQPFGIV